jgi:hypothetical protein
MASVGPVVGGQGVINDPDPFGAAAWGILTVFLAHAPPDVIWNAFLNGGLLSELTVQKISGAAFSAGLSLMRRFEQYSMAPAKL